MTTLSISARPIIPADVIMGVRSERIPCFRPIRSEALGFGQYRRRRAGGGHSSKLPHAQKGAVHCRPVPPPGRHRQGAGQLRLARVSWARLTFFLPPSPGVRSRTTQFSNSTDPRNPSPWEPFCTYQIKVIPMGNRGIGKKSDGLVSLLPKAKSIAFPMFRDKSRAIVNMIRRQELGTNGAAPSSY